MTVDLFSGKAARKRLLYWKRRAEQAELERDEAVADALRRYESFKVDQVNLRILGARLAKVPALVEALRQIGTPRHVPEHYDANDWWHHRASKCGELAREALAVWESETESRATEREDTE